MQLKLTFLAAALAIASFASAAPTVYPRQAAGTPSGKAPGTQFITGNCASDADCASGCCAAGKGLCAARLVAQEGAGCGFTPAGAAPAAAAPAAAPPASAAAAAPAASGTAAGTSSGKAPGTQFITGNCASDADCASGCCAAGKGTCAARLVAQEGAGCGFTPAGAAPAAAAPAAAPPASAAAAAPAASGTAAGTSSGKAPGTQFITGNCASDADCASGCCAKGKGTCAARLVAQEGQGCGFTPA